jgi:hypothetical protein
MTQQAPEAFAAFVGLDWADAKHAICLQAAGAAHRECLPLEHRPDVIDAWVQSLRTRCNGQPVAVCLELTKGPIVSARCTYDCLVLFPQTTPPMPHSRSNSCSPPATRSPPLSRTAPPCAPWRNWSNTVGVWSATQSV